MRILIDTHCWISVFGERRRLNKAALAMMASEETTVVFSTVSAAEIGIKAGLGKLTFPEPVQEYVASRVEISGMKTLPLYLHHALRVAELPLHHRDPFDRLLVAQARAEGLPLMTADPELAAYDVDIIWAGTDPAPEKSN
jgi:PIN domain nuclease of toxin-antitoxin system